MTDDVKVDVRRSGRRFEAEAVLDLTVDAQTVWDTITDYEALSSFMPGIHACQVIERRPLTKATAMVIGNVSNTPVTAASGEAACMAERLQSVRDREFEVRPRPAATAA